MSDTLNIAPEAPTAPSPLHMLVVDDDDVDRERVQRYLAHAPLKVITHEATSGEEALRLIRSRPFDCVVLDHQLGDTTGSTLLGQLREQTGQDVPVIMVTGAGNEALVVQALQDGATDYLSKIHLTEDSLVRSVMRSLETHKLRRDLNDMHRQLERRVEEQAATIRQRERDLQDILDHTSSLIGYWAADGRVRFGNRAHQAWLGIRAEDLPGMQVCDAIGETMHAIHHHHIQQALQGQPQLFEYALPSGNPAELQHYQAEYRPDVQDDGRVAGFYVTITDITQIKVTQVRIEELLRFVKAVIDHSPVGIAVYRHDGQCAMANAAMADVTGIPLDQLTRQALAMLLVGDSSELFDHGQRTLDDGQTRHIELSVSKGGTPTRVACSLARVYRGSDAHLLVIARDITEQSLLQDTLINARNAAQEAARITSVFLANMSHEIRTPMNAIIGLSRLALEESMPPSARAYIERVHDSALALMGILDDVLDYSKGESGQMTLEHIEIDLQDLLQRMADMFSARIAQKRLSFSIELGTSVPQRIMGDPLRLSQVLNNFVGNATKFTDTGGITVSAATHGDQLRLAVRDTGIGIDPQRREALFAAFAQGDASITRRYGGTGLGLAICKQLVTLMGGTIGVSSPLDGGSEFWFTIPLIPAGPAHEAPRLHALLLGRKSPGRQQLARLLAHVCKTYTVVDDLSLCHQVLDGAGASPVALDAVLVDGQTLGADLVNTLRGLLALLQRDGQPDTRLLCVTQAHDQASRDAIVASGTGAIALTQPVLPHTLSKLLGAGDRSHAADAGLAPAESLRRRGLPLVGRRVLLVEDNPLNQMVAQAFLHQAGLEVETRNHGEEAVQRMMQAQAGEFAAILMDMHMPVMDGLEASRRIRQMPQAQGIPIIAMTAAVLPADRQRCADAGMVEMVTKPIDPEGLIDVLLQWAQPQH